MANPCRSMIAVLLCMIMPGSLLAAAPGAMIYAKGGDVLLNGVVAPESSALFAGDSLTTSASSAVHVTLQGSSVLVDPKSTLLYEGSFFDLSAGGASVMTRNQMQGRSGGVTVTPVALVETHYRMAHKDGSLLVAAVAGSVKVVDHGAETLLAAGEAKSFAADPPDQNDKNDKRRRGAPPTPAGISEGGLLLIGGAVAGGAALIVFLTTRGPCKKVSPEHNPHCR